MKYNKSLMNKLFDIKETLKEEDKEIVELFMQEYNENYAKYIEILSEIKSQKNIENKNSRLRTQLEKKNETIKDLTTQIEKLKKELEQKELTIQQVFRKEQHKNNTQLKDVINFM